MKPIVGKSKAKASIEAVVIRADGTREDLGVIARWHRNPLVRLAWWVQDLVERRRRRIEWR